MDNRALTRLWIQYLKSNQLVELKSDPKSGKLNYKKPITLSVLYRFLELKTDYGNPQIAAAMKSVLANRSTKIGGPKNSDSDPDAEQQKQLSAPDIRQLSGPKAEPVQQKRKFSKGDATDVEFKDLNEDITDDHQLELDEKDVESIFTILSSTKPEPEQQDDGQTKRGQPKGKGVPTTPQEPDPADAQQKKQDDLNKIARLIRDTLTDTQRKTLWRALKDA